MDARLQHRVQRYGWDLAVEQYAQHWHALLAGVQAELLALAAPLPGEQVLDVACGTGIVSLGMAAAVGPTGRVLGVDLSERMVLSATARAQEAGVVHAQFERMNAEALSLPEASFDLVTCGLGLMYLPDADAALREMQRVLRPGGRVMLAVWGERARCGWASVFGIVDAEVRSEVCPLFFRLGQGDNLARSCAAAGLAVTHSQRRNDALWHASEDAACEAALAGGPVALAWSRFNADTRERVRANYLDAIAPWREDSHYRLPAQFVLVAAQRADPQSQTVQGGLPNLITQPL